VDVKDACSLSLSSLGQIAAVGSAGSLLGYGDFVIVSDNWRNLKIKIRVHIRVSL
jgi:hypothetical protein